MKIFNENAELGSLDTSSSMSVFDTGDNTRLKIFVLVSFSVRKEKYKYSPKGEYWNYSSNKILIQLLQFWLYRRKPRESKTEVANWRPYPFFRSRYPLHCIDLPTTLKFPRRAWASLSHSVDFPT